MTVSNGLLSTVRDLARRRARRRRDLTLAEGIRLVEEVLEADAGIRGIVTAPMLEASERGRALKARLARVPGTSVEVTDPELVELADTEHPQGVIAVVQPPTHTLEDISVSVRRPVLVIDRKRSVCFVSRRHGNADRLGQSSILQLRDQDVVTATAVTVPGHVDPAIARRGYCRFPIARRMP